MINIKIISLISAFNEKERKEFSDFIKSPYYSKSRNYSHLLKTVYEFSDKGESRGLTNKDFFDKAFPGLNYKNKTIRNRLNEITTLAKKFILEKSLNSDKDTARLLMLKGLRERKLFKPLMSEYEKVTNSANEQDYKTFQASESMLLQTYALLLNQDFKNALKSYRKYSDYTITLILEKYFSIMLEYESQKQYGLNMDENIAFFLMDNFKADKFISVIENKKDSSFLTLLLYYYMYKSFHDMNDEEVYAKFSSLFFRNIKQLSYEQKKDFFGYMISRFFNLVNSGKHWLLKDVFRIYNLKLKLGIYSELKEVRYPSTAFRDYVVVGLRLKKYKWVEKFIDKYSCELPDEIRDIEVNMAYTRLYLFRREYDKVIEITGKFKSANYLDILDVSRLKLRAYYEKSYFEEAYMEIDRMKHYIKNNTSKIPLPVRKYSKLFMDIFGNLLKLKLSPDKKEAEYFYKTIKEHSTLVGKDWIIEKIKEIRTGI